MADIQSATAEIRQGKKKETTGQKYNGLPYSIVDHQYEQIVVNIITLRTNLSVVRM